MNPEYQRLRQEADRLFHHFNDVCDDKAAAAGLLSDIKNVVEDFEMSKNPHSIEDRVKRIAEELKHLRDNNSILDPRHGDELYDAYEELRQHIRKLSNY